MNPTQAQVEPLVRQAMEAFQRSQWGRAGELAEQALTIAPENYEAIQVRALASLYAGRAADALPHAESLVARFPSDPFAHNTHGAVLQVLGRLEEAIAAYRKSISLAPTHALSWFNVAQVYARLARHDEAAPCFEKTIQLGAATPDAFLGLAQANMQMGRLEAALGPAREAARLAPQSAEAVRIAAQCELKAGDVGAAVEGFRSLESIAPPPDRWRFIRSIIWPAVEESRERIGRRWEEVEQAVDDLIARPARIADPLRDVGLTGFHMAYQGFDDTQLQKKIAHAYRLASPDLEWSAPHVARPRRANQRIRLGILSRHLNNHTIGKLNIGIAQKLDRKRFEVVVMRTPAERDFLSGAFDECADRVVTLPADLVAARLKVAEAELDALFYPDIGMDAFTYYLAFARLARVQFTTWGHPVTTGIPNMDYFLSARDAEPEDGQRYYSERLVPFENPPSYYYRPREPSSFDIRAQLGLSAADRIYASLQTLYKIHPDFDRALVEILRRDPRGRVVLIAAKRQAWNDKLRRRLEREGPDVATRIIFMPAMSLPDYLAALRGADALLDTFHFGGGSSSYESFGMSSPVVTLPGERMRARITAALYARMGQSHWVARSADHFVELALELADGQEHREAWRREIQEGAHRFLENDSVIREYEDFIAGAVG